MIKDDVVDYIVVDRRLSRALPVLGYYFEPDERGAFSRRRPMSAGLAEEVPRRAAV